MHDEHLPVAPPPTLAQEEGEHGRIGYGRLARYSPLGIALVLVALLVVVVAVRDRTGNPSGTGKLAGKPAPAIAFTTFDGQQINLAALEGSVVVLNFWAEWCAPCKEEMPAFQRVHEAAIAGGEPVVILGVDIKNDVPDNARPFAESLGITYPIGQDHGGGDRLYGDIQLAFEIDPSYPTTVFIRPDGVVDTVRVGSMDETEIRERIAHAAGAR